MEVFLFIWNGVLTVALIFLALAFIGKNARDAREKAALVHDVNAELEAGKKWMNLLSERIDKLLEVMQNLQKTSQYDNSTLAGSMEQIENRIAQLQETQKGLQQDVNLLLRADDEHPVTAVIGGSTKSSKGGRPRKEGS